MDHHSAHLQNAVEHYLLKELDPRLRDEFEEHFFACPDCARDVRAASSFIEHSRVILAQSTRDAEVVRPLPYSIKASWAARLRPLYAGLALTLLLAVVGYQNLVTYPRLRQPQILPMTSLNIGTFSGEGPSIDITPGQGFLLFVRIPPDGAYASYLVDLYGPEKLEWSLAIPAASGQDLWPVQVPGTKRVSGDYTVVVRGVTPPGETNEIGRKSFVLQIHQ